MRRRARGGGRTRREVGIVLNVKFIMDVNFVFGSPNPLLP